MDNVEKYNAFFQTENAPSADAMVCTLNSWIVLYDKYRDELIAYLQGRYRVSKETAEDIVHDVFVIQYAGREQLTGIVSKRAYLYKCVGNMYLNYIKSAWQKNKQETNENIFFREDENAIHINVEKEEDRKALRNAVQDLPCGIKEAIVLRFYIRLKNREIALTLDITEHAVESRIKRGIAALKAALSK